MEDTIIARLFNAQIIRWAEPDSEGGQVWEVITSNGAMLRADSLQLLINALSEERDARSPPPLRLAA